MQSARNLKSRKLSRKSRKPKSNPTIGIIGGRGKMGSVFADFFIKNGHKVLISDLNTTLTAEKLATDSDIVIISVPIDKTAEVIRKVVPLMRESQLLMDFTSVKEMPIREMMKSKSAVIGLHPMFNDTTFGPGQKILMCPKRPRHWLPWLRDIFIKKGKFLLYEMSESEHDKLMSIVQCMVHFAEFAFGKALQERGLNVEGLLPFASPASALKIEIASRLLSQDANLYGNIQIASNYNMEVIDTFVKCSKNLAEIVRAKDLKGFEKYFNDAAKFLGPYKDKAQKESDFVILNWLGKFDKKPTIEQKKCSSGDVAILGPEKSYSHFAANEISKKFKLKNELYFTLRIEDVFNLVSRKKVVAGIVPIENIIEGTIRETIDGLFKNNVKIIGEIGIPIHHCLCALDKNAKITAIYSHPQGFKQSSRFLNKNFKKTEINFRPSTSSAFEYVKKLRLTDSAVIGSEEAARNYGFEIVTRNIENDHRNNTTFVLITHQNSRFKIRNTPRKTSIIFHFDKDSSGTLYQVLGEFAKEKINLTKIESRPAGHRLGDYVFLVEFSGTVSRAKKALSAIKKKVAKLKIVGEY